MRFPNDVDTTESVRFVVAGTIEEARYKRRTPLLYPVHIRILPVTALRTVNISQCTRTGPPSFCSAQPSVNDPSGVSFISP